MNKWKRYRKIELVDVLLFEKPEDPANPPYPIELSGCGCEAQDGYTCEQHRTPPRYSYVYRAIDRRVRIRPGEYLIRFNNGQAMTCTPAELGMHYEPAGASTE